MIDTKTLADELKSAPMATSISGLSTVLVNIWGELVKTGVILIPKEPMSSGDLNDVTDWRIVRIDSFEGNIQNVPVNVQGMLLFSFGTYHIILRSGSGGVIYFRAYSNGTWLPWKSVTMTAVP